MIPCGGRNTIIILPLDTRLQHQFLLEFLAYQSALQIFDLPAPNHMWYFLKINFQEIYICIYKYIHASYRSVCENLNIVPVPLCCYVITLSRGRATFVINVLQCH